MQQKEIFNLLDSTRHLNRDNQQLDIFTEYNIQHSNNPDNEFWYLSDLHNIFGPSVIPTELVFGNQICSKTIVPYDINKKKFPKLTPEQKHEFQKSHSERTERKIKLNSLPFSNNIDHKATRYACWSFVKDNPDALFAYIYFMIPACWQNASFKDIKNLTAQYARINARYNISEKERQLGALIKRLGGNHALFYHTSTPALFNGNTADEIKDMHNIPHLNNDPLLNYMSAQLLNARSNAISKTVNKFKTQPSYNQTLNKLHDILCEELRNARNETYKTTGFVPEKQITQYSIDYIQKHKKEKELTFIQKYANQKIK
jgi:hypothetical protein